MVSSKVTLSKTIEKGIFEASAPCRVDMGGTLDIKTFYYPLRHLSPCTFNIAIGLRTVVSIHPFSEGMVKVSSKGFESAEFSIDKVPFDHPLGLIFSIASYFRAEGVHIDIKSLSPPRSALGGSSSAAVALVGLFLKIFENMNGEPFSRQKAAILAHGLEESVAGVPCGFQDQLAAAFGGVNAWYWTGKAGGPLFKRKAVIEKSSFKEFENHFLVAYCGIPHESKNINNRWVQQFISGKYRSEWKEVVTCTKKFVEALSLKDYKKASEFMNRELSFRTKMTPDVLDDMGIKLADIAAENNCGARFTGAGGGGCIWALGNAVDIGRLKEEWEEALKEREGACLLDSKIDSKGIIFT